MLPVAYMVAKFEPWIVENPVALVVGVEIEVERINNVIRLVDCHDYTGACVPYRAVCGGSRALKPAGEGSNSLVGGCVDLPAAICECI